MDSPGADSSLVTALAPDASVKGSDYSDRSTALIVFGIIEILGGALVALAIPLMLLGVVFARKAGGAPPASSLTVSIVSYALLAAVLVTLGIGAAMAKRWACSLNLILSWVWLLGGACGTVALILFMPQGFMASLRAASEENPNANQVSTGVAAVILTFFIVAAAVFMVVLPLIFLLFYRSRNAIETCRHRDPVERWTDRRPLPVIALALLAAASTVYYVAMSVTGPLFPFFGKYLTGWAAAGVLLTLAAADAYVAVSFLQLKLTGWWVAVIAVTLRMLSSAITFARTNLLDAYMRMGWSEAQLRALRASPIFRSNAIAWWSMGFMVIYFGFLLWLKRYFRPAAAPSYTGLGDMPLGPPQPGS